MSKIWLLLLLVAAVGFANAFPVDEESDVEEDDLIELEDEDLYDFELFEFDNSEEEERGFKDTMKQGWKDFKGAVKEKYKKVKASIKKKFKAAKQWLKDKSIKVSPLKCQNNICKSCIVFLLKKNKSYCIEAQFGGESGDRHVKLTLIREKDDEEKKQLFPSAKVSMNKVPTSFNVGKLGKMLLTVCDVDLKTSNGKPVGIICLALLSEKFNVGVKLCIRRSPEGQVSVKPKLFIGDVDDGKMIEAGESGDEGKPVDAYVE